MGPGTGQVPHVWSVRLSVSSFWLPNLGDHRELRQSPGSPLPVDPRIHSATTTEHLLCAVSRALNLNQSQSLSLESPLVGSEGRDVMGGGDHGACDRPGEVPDPAWEVREGFVEEVIFMSRPKG